MSTNTKSHYFISDAHFGAIGESSEEAISDFIDVCKEIQEKGKSLFLLGDLFDFFFDYKTVIPRDAFLVLCALRELTSAKIEITYICGNHDFWLGNFLEKEINIKVIKKQLVQEIDGVKVHMEHGDNFLIKDKLFGRLFGKIVKSRFNRKLYRIIHPDLAIPLALRVSLLSRKRSERCADKEKIIHSYRMRANSCITDTGVDAVITGHTHFSDLFSFGSNRYYINTGSWSNNRDYITLENGVFQQCQYKQK